MDSSFSYSPSINPWFINPSRERSQFAHGCSSAQRCCVLQEKILPRRVACSSLSQNCPGHDNLKSLCQNVYARAGCDVRRTQSFGLGAWLVHSSDFVLRRTKFRRFAVTNKNFCSKKTKACWSQLGRHKACFNRILENIRFLSCWILKCIHLWEAKCASPIIYQNRFGCHFRVSW